MKQNWEVPRLIILARNEPAELIIYICKQEESAADLDSYYGGCWVENLGGCMGCKDYYGS